MTAHILVVDDSASMRQMVAFTLTGAGFTVTEAEDGVVALGKAKGAKFNAVVTDVNMPTWTASRSSSTCASYRTTSSPRC
jgi:two-component system chemotaxis response regulator CheY